MKADISRATFDARRHATGVRKQQGRVDLDADWNEQRDIEDHLRAVTLLDVVGPAGAPIDDDAFALTAAAGDLTLSAGRYYVDGVLCECDDDVSVFAQPDLPAEGPFVRLLDGTWVEAPATAAPGVYVAWLEATSSLVTTIDDPAIREVALGGPDTATRARTRWQVRLLQAGAPGDDVGCADEPPGWDDLTAPSTGTLAAFADPTGAPVGDCLVPASAPYRGLDNQFFRFEIHVGGPPGTATYVCSRDNGSVVAAWEASDVDVLTLVRPGQRGSDGFSNGCWVELTDDRHDQLGLPGTLVQVDRVEDDRIVVDATTATGSIDIADFAGHPKARRWDSTGTIPDDGSDIDIELGVKARAAAGAGVTYRTGDYWGFPARAATHDVEWPRDVSGPIPRTPDGPHAANARLAVLAFDGTDWTVVRDCRPLFAPLVDQLALAYLGGDGQQACPDIADPTALVALGESLLVGVANGGRPIAGARVRFAVVAGTGTVDGATTVDVTTGADGLASAEWSVDSTLVLQEATATLLAEDGTARGASVRFAARLDRADGTSYDAAASPSLAGAVTVQDAIDRLAATTGDGCHTLTLSPGGGWVEALASIPEGADASVCFRPGTYESAEPARLRSLGHVHLSGAGVASALTVAGSEVALSFEECASVTMENLRVEVTTYPVDSVRNDLGVVTAVDCGPVRLTDVELVCPAAPGPRAACLTVRGDNVPAALDVDGCTMVVGHAQTGALLVDVTRAHVTGSTFTTPARPATLDLGGLLGDVKVRDRLAKLLAGRLVLDRADQADRGGFNTALRVKDWVVRMNSTVPEPEWKALVAAQPPADADVASAEALQAYMARVTDRAAADPAVLPTFDRQVRALRSRLGAGSERVFGTEEGLRTVRGLLASDAVEVKPVATTRAVARAVSLPTNQGSVRFDSLLDQGTWEAALLAAPARDTSPVAIARHVKQVSRRLLSDAAFAHRIFPGLFDRLRLRDAAAGDCGVRIGGRRADDVVVERNRMDGVVEAVHVGVSQKRPLGGAVRRAGSVRVVGNDITLSVPVDRAQAPRAVFVGNADRVVVRDNRSSVGNGTAIAGVQVEGMLGRHVVVRDNELAGCRTGVALRNHGEVPGSVLWIVDDNFVPGAAVAVDASPPASVNRNVT